MAKGEWKEKQFTRARGTATELRVRRWDVSAGEADYNIAHEGLQRESPERYTD